jgi:small subunit ribosomal protein S9
MSDNRQSLSDLASLTGAAPAPAPAAAAAPADVSTDEAPAAAPVVPAVPTTPLREQEIDAQGRAYATGRRKDAVARVWLKPGTGKITVNGRDQEVYFARPTLRLVINQAFGVSEREGQYDVICTVKGGGLDRKSVV